MENEQIFLTLNDRKYLCLPCAAEVEPKIVAPPITYNGTGRGTCVIRMGGLGDLILLSSGLRELKKRMGKKRFTFATAKANVPFMEKLGFIDRVIDVNDFKTDGFGKVIDLRFAVEPPELGTHCKGTWESYTMEDRSDAFDKLLGVYPSPKRFIVPVDQKVSNRMVKFLPGSFVLIVCSMVAAARSIPPAYIKPLCEMIVKKLGISVVLSGMSQPWNSELKSLSMSNVVNLVDKTSTPEMISLCSLADLVVTPDTGTLHVAGAIGKKTLGIFGNINPRTRISYYKNVKTLYPHGAMKCLPCSDLHPCSFEPQEGPECMRMTTPSVIFRAVQEWL